MLSLNGASSPFNSLSVIDTKTDLRPADMFAFGVCLFTMLNDREPFAEREVGGLNELADYEEQNRRINIHTVRSIDATGGFEQFLRNRIIALFHREPTKRPSAQ